jgi:carbon-monoxide dehydrogenase large subunit
MQPFDKAAHVTKMELVNNRLIPNAMEPRAAIGDYDPAKISFTLYTTSQNPHVTGWSDRPSCWHPRAQAAGGRTRCGRRLRLEDLHLCRRGVCLWAPSGLARPVKWTADRTEAFMTDAHGRDHVTRELALDANGKFTGLRVRDDRQHGRLSLDLRAVGADLSARHADGRPVQDPGIYA